MTPGTPGAKIPHWRSRLKGAWLIKVGETQVSSIADAQDAFTTAIASGSLFVKLLFTHPEIREEDEISAMSPSEIETQFTILANADICDISLNTKKGYGDYSSDAVPSSQADDAEDNGESQVVWFAAARG